MSKSTVNLQPIIDAAFAPLLELLATPKQKWLAGVVLPESDYQRVARENNITIEYRPFVREDGYEFLPEVDGDLVAVSVFRPAGYYWDSPKDEPLHGPFPSFVCALEDAADVFGFDVEEDA